jgi:NitT/TauT family transport system substrate-binding protein
LLFSRELLSTPPCRSERGNEAISEAVCSGAIEVRWLGRLLTAAILASQVDPDIRVIGQLQVGLAGAITGSNKLQQETGLTESSPLAAKAKALVGKKIGVVSTTGLTGAFVAYLLHQFGLDFKKEATLVTLDSTVASAVCHRAAGWRRRCTEFLRACWRNHRVSGPGTYLDQSAERGSS